MAENIEDFPANSSDTRMKSLASRMLSAIVPAEIVTGIASAQNAVTLWNSIAVKAALTAKSTGGMTELFLGYSNLAAFTL